MEKKVEEVKFLDARLKKKYDLCCEDLKTIFLASTGFSDKKIKENTRLLMRIVKICTSMISDDFNSINENDLDALLPIDLEILKEWVTGIECIEQNFSVILEMTDLIKNTYGKIISKQTGNA